MTIVSLLKPKGEAIGFKVSNNMYEQIVQVTEFLGGYQIDIRNIRTMVANDINCLELTIQFNKPSLPVTWTVFGGQYVYMPNDASDMPIATYQFDPDSEIIERKGNVYNSMEEITALLIEEGNMVETFKQVADWVNVAGHDFDSFKNGTDGYIIEIDGCESEPLAVGDYVFFDEYDNLRTYSLENLESDGYEVNE